MITTVDIDLAKNVLTLHDIDATGAVKQRRNFVKVGWPTPSKKIEILCEMIAGGITRRVSFRPGSFYAIRCIQRPQRDVWRPAIPHRLQFMIDSKIPVSMQIILNGKPEEVADSETAAALITRLGLTGKRLALEVNREVLPRSRHDSYRLRPNDRIEIVQAIGGG